MAASGKSANWSYLLIRLIRIERDLRRPPPIGLRRYPEHTLATSMEPDFLTTEQLAARLGLKPATIKGWRYRGIGPEWHELPRIDRSPRTSRVRYRLEDVKRWESIGDD